MNLICKYIYKLFNLKGKACIITGGAGLLGSAFSRAVSEKGASLVIADINEQKGAALAEKIKQDLRKEVASMSVSLAGKVLEREINEEDHKALIDKSLDVMGS